MTSRLGPSHLPPHSISRVFLRPNSPHGRQSIDIVFVCQLKSGWPLFCLSMAPFCLSQVVDEFHGPGKKLIDDIPEYKTGDVKRR